MKTINIEKDELFNNKKKKLEEYSISELEEKIYYYEKIFQGLVMTDFITISKVDKYEYSNALFKVSNILTKLKNARDKKYNELSNSEKKEHIINTYTYNVEQYINGRLKK